AYPIVRAHLQLNQHPVPTRRSSDLAWETEETAGREGWAAELAAAREALEAELASRRAEAEQEVAQLRHAAATETGKLRADADREDRKSTRLNSSHVKISYAVFCLKK